MPAVRALHGLRRRSTSTARSLGGDPGAGRRRAVPAARRIEAWLASDHEDGGSLGRRASVSDVADVVVTERPTTAPPLAPRAQPSTRRRSARDHGRPRQPAQRRRRRAADGRAPSRRRTNHAQPARVRVDAERLDQLMHLMGELVIHRTAVEALAQTHRRRRSCSRRSRTCAQLAGAAGDGHAGADDPRRVGLPALPAARARPLQRSSARRSSCELVGQDTELDRTVVDALGDPLVHLVRNALDHGLEPPDERVAAGKPPHRRARDLRPATPAATSSSACATTAAGSTPQHVARKRALERGLIDAEASRARSTRSGAAELLFTPGFSTAETTSDISGRGVGMDAVRAEDPRARRRGAVDVRRPAQGTTAPDPPAADARDRSRALLVEVDGAAVRDPARPRRAHAAARRPHGPLRRRRAACSSLRGRRAAVAATRRRRSSARAPDRRATTTP